MSLLHPETQWEALTLESVISSCFCLHVACDFILSVLAKYVELFYICKCNLNLLLEFFKVIKYIDVG